MRIVVVTSQFPIAGEPHRGRPLHQTVRQLSAMADVHVVSPVASYPRWLRPRSYLFRAAGQRYQVAGCRVEYTTYPVLPLLTRPLNGWLCGRTLDATLRTLCPDVVLSYWLYPDAHGAMLAARRAGIPFLAGARGSDLRVRDPVSRRLTRPVVSAARRLLVVSEDLGRVAVRDYGAEPSRVRVIPNGCDAGIFHPSDRAQARQALDVANDAELVLYVGRLVAGKGLRELMDAIATLSPRHPRLQLVLVGEGPLQGELADRARREPGLRIHFAGPQAPSDVARWMVAANLVTLPSHSEGHPNVLVEAMACGRPIVATSVGGVPEIVDAASGILVPARNAPALADGLARALKREWDETGLARRCSRDWRQVARDTLDACTEAVAS